jgi:hypothetical protein
VTFNASTLYDKGRKLTTVTGSLADRILDAEVVLPCDELDETLAFFADLLGFCIDGIQPADDPELALPTPELRPDRDFSGRDTWSGGGVSASIDAATRHEILGGFAAPHPLEQDRYELRSNTVISSNDGQSFACQRRGRTGG